MYLYIRSKCRLAIFTISFPAIDAINVRFRIHLSLSLLHHNDKRARPVSAGGLYHRRVGVLSRRRSAHEVKVEILPSSVERTAVSIWRNILFSLGRVFNWRAGTGWLVGWKGVGHER